MPHHGLSWRRSACPLVSVAHHGVLREASPFGAAVACVVPSTEDDVCDRKTYNRVHIDMVHSAYPHR